jgi:hypothetical protein
MEQAREAKGLEREGAWDEAEAEVEEVVLQQALANRVFVRTVEQRSPTA